MHGTHQKPTDSRGRSYEFATDINQQATPMDVGNSPSLHRKVKHIRGETRALSLESERHSCHFDKGTQRDISPVSDSSKSDDEHASDQYGDRDLIWIVCDDELLTDEEKKRQERIFKRLGQLTKLGQPLENLVQEHMRIESGEFDKKKKSHRARSFDPKDDELVASGDIEPGSKRSKFQRSDAAKRKKLSFDDSQGSQSSHKPEANTINVLMKGMAEPLPITISYESEFTDAEIASSECQEAVQHFVDFLATKDDLIIDDEDLMFPVSVLESAMIPCSWSYSERVSDFIDKVEYIHRFIDNKEQSEIRKAKSLESLNRFLISSGECGHPTFDRAVENFKYVTEKILSAEERKRIAESSCEYFHENFLGYRFSKSYIRQFLCATMEHDGIYVEKFDEKGSTVYRFCFSAVPCFDGLSGYMDERPDAFSMTVDVFISLKDGEWRVSLAEMYY